MPARKIMVSTSPDLPDFSSGVDFMPPAARSNKIQTIQSLPSSLHLHHLDTPVLAGPR